MKILQVNAVNEYGSTGRTCSEMNAYLWEHGHECYTAFSVGNETAHTLRISTAFECKIHALLSRITGLQGYYSPFSTHKLINYIEKIQPDILVLRNLHANYVSMGTLFRYVANHDIPTVLALDDCWFFTGGCTHYTALGCDRWKTGCGGCPSPTKNRPNWFFDRSARVWSDRRKWYHAIPRLGVAGVSKWITNEARNSPLVDSAKVFACTYNWIDTDVFQKMDVSSFKASLNISGKNIVLGVASSWSESKGLSSFCELAKKLGTEYTVILVGKMPEGISLPENVLSPGATRDISELVSYYNLADVFVTVSPEESFGKVSAEALSCGTPVVCYDATANAEIVGDGCGAVIPLGDLGQMTAAINDICQTGKESFSARCREFATSHFGKEKCMKAYLEMFSELIDDYQTDKGLETRV